MIVRKPIAALLGAAALTALTAQMSSANTAIASINVTSTNQLVTFTGGSKGALYLPSAPGTAGDTLAASETNAFPVPAVFTFGPVTVAGPATTSNGVTTELLSSGNFALKSTTGGATLLSGTFTQSSLSANSLPTTSGSVQSFGSNTVMYTGGSFLTDAGFKAGDIGTFSLSLSGISPSLNTTDNYFNAFTVGSAANTGALSGTFDVLPSTPPAVPEPGTVASFAFGGLGLMGLALRARKSTRRAA